MKEHINMSINKLNEHIGMNIIYVEWLDAVSHDEWIHLDEADLNTVLIKSVGFLVSDTKESITLALNYDTINNNISCYINIPNKWIKSKRLIKL